MRSAVVVSCRDGSGEILGELAIVDARGRETLELDGDLLSLSESGDYVLRLTGPQAHALRFAAPIAPLPFATAGELIGTLGRPPGLGLVRVELADADGGVQWRRDIPVRPEKLRDRAEFEEMVADLCRWRTALALDLNAGTSAPWVWSDTPGALTPEERLVVLRAAIEDNRLFANIEHVERTALARLSRGVELVALGRDEVDPFRLGRYLNGPGARVTVPVGHPLAGRIASLPSRLPPSRKIEATDTPENQFVKVAIRRFRTALSEALQEMPHYADSRLAQWAREAEERLTRVATSRFFAEVSWPAHVALGSPALQRREGYRSILRAFLDLRAGFSLPWDELGAAVFGETRDVPTVYELWCLVRLRAALEAEFSASLDLDNFLLEGAKVAVRRGSASHAAAPILLNGAPFALRFHYNRTFQASPATKSWPFVVHGEGLGTWSKTMKPDFTVALWPAGSSEMEAASEKRLRLVHFDAKYRLRRPLSSSEATHVPDDVDKMHAYAAAINHSRGAYALYPGDAAELLAGPEQREIVGVIPVAPARSDALGPMLRAVLERAVAA